MPGKNRVRLTASELQHIGMPRRSGRYPWGSGKNPFQNSVSFMGAVQEFRDQGLSATEIARGLGMSTTEFRIQIKLASEERKASLTAQCIELRDKGLSKVAIGQRLGIPDTTVGNYLRQSETRKGKITHNVADMLRESVAQNGFIDVGKGVAPTIGITEGRLSAAQALLRAEGYRVHTFKVKQKGTGLPTSIKTLSGPYKDDDEFKAAARETWKDLSRIKPVTGRTEDMGISFDKNELQPPQSLSSDRVMIRYGPEGGSDRDGVIELRRGVEDLDLGKANYAQVRIAVDNSHYMKGMAMYSDNVPDGFDAVYNTNKPRERAPEKHQVFKKFKEVSEMTLENNPTAMFGATIDTQRGCLNVIREEGEWNDWTRALSSQMLSKQSTALAKQQLGLQYNLRKEELDQIKSYTNPTVRKKLLDSFSKACDKDAVHLQAAALPRQCNSIILPVPSLKPNEIYAPNFNNGETVALIRHPHGGTFEIPVLTVNNKNREARSTMGTAPLDAVGIHPEAAQRLSGADFDGDHVIVIPNPVEGGQIRTQPLIGPLADLRTFDHQNTYAPFDGMKTIDGGVWNQAKGEVVYPRDAQGAPIRKTRNMGTEMGRISNLITDMTIQGATPSELVRAVKHSMVIVDAEKHSLNFGESAKQNGISQLRKKYQAGARGGAETIISRAKSPRRIPELAPGQYIGHPHRVTGEPTQVLIDPKTGKELFRRKQQRVVDADGNVRFEDTRTKRKVTAPDGTVTWETTQDPVRMEVTRMREVQLKGQSAHTLVSAANTPMERAYADHANRMMSLGDEARRVMVNTPHSVQNPSAKRAYADEVARLNAQYDLVLQNKPRERAAQIMADSITNRQIQDNPGMRDEEVRRAGLQNLTAQRKKQGAERVVITINDREWEAIQAGALSTSRLNEILNHVDEGRIRELATPRERKASLSGSQIERARQMLAQGHTQSEVAQSLGVSTTVLLDQLYGN